MRRGSKHITKKVFIPEENEEEKYRKVQAKKIQLRAEFEKHKKEILVNTTDISKSSEIRLKNQLEELMNANERRTKELERLENIESRLENTNMEATYFYEQISKLEASKDNETYLSVGFHPNRTTSTMFGVRHSNFLDSLGDKKAQLLDTLANIELLLEQEEDATSATQEKYQDMKKDQILLSKKIHELEKMNDHADKRFTDLQRIEFLAMNRHAASTSNLKTVKDDLREIKNQELAYKKQKETDKKREIEFLNAKQNEVSNVLVELDRKRQEDQQKQEELRRLELQHEEMRVKRKNTRIVTQYIEIFHALQGENRLNLGAINQALKDISDQMDSSRSSSHKPPSVPEKKSSSRNNSRDNSPTRRSNRPGSEEPASPIKINSAVQRNVYIEKIQRFYEKFVEGPERLAETIIKRYLDNCFKEESLKNGFEEMQNRKKRQENELQKLEKELEVMKARNEYIGQGYTGSKILDSNEQEAIDSGMLTIDKLPTTLSQAKFDFEHKKTVDKEIDLVNSTEAFVMRCYFDTVEMMTRFSKLLNSIQATSGGNIPTDLKDLIKTAQSQLQFVRKEKKANQQLDVSMSGALSEGRNDLHINLTENGNGSITDKDQEIDQKIDLREINDMFLSMFEGYHNEAAQFTALVNNDVIISSFITLEDIKKYLQSFQREVFLEAQIQKVLTETTDLRETALKNMLGKFDICYKLYMDILAITQQSTDYTCNRLKARGYDIHFEDIDRRESEPNEYMEKAVHKKWQNLVDKYDYDPGRDFRKENMETETTDDNFGNYHREHLDDMEAAERELWDNDDFNSKLNEMMGTGFGKTKAMKQFENNQTLFKSRTEVEARKAQLKKEKEKQKRIAMENMTDDEFLDWQRKQMKKDGQEDIEEEKPEYDAKRKAQLEMTQRLSPTMRVEELKRMIGNSKLLSKIQILEKQRFATDERNNFKLTSVENYVPLEPKKIVKNPTSPEYKIRIRKAQTPTDRVTRTRFVNENSDRLSEPEENVEPLRDSALKIATTKSASKFKPQEIFEFGSVPNKVPERPHTQGSKRLRPFGDPRKWPLGDSIEESRQRSVEKSGSAVLIKSKSHNKLKRKKLLVQTIDNKLTENKSTVSKTKSGQSLLLKPEKPSKRLSASNKKLNLSTDKFLMKGQGPLYELLNKQADSRLNMVYAPNFFTGGFQNSSMTDDVNAFKNSGILVPEKL